MSICVSAFDDIQSGDKVEWKYADKAQANDNAGGSSENTNGSTSTSSSSNETESDEMENSSDDSPSQATELRPGFVQLAIAIVVVGSLLSFVQ